jgi:cytochrome c oxidase subunit IV
MGMAGIRQLILVWLALMVLLGVTVAASFYLTGALSVAASLSISLVTAALIFWFFMDLRRESGLIRIFAVGAAAWLIILLLLASADYLTRGIF